MSVWMYYTTHTHTHTHTHACTHTNACGIITGISQITWILMTPQCVYHNRLPNMVIMNTVSWTHSKEKVSKTFAVSLVGFPLIFVATVLPQVEL